jgi:hypothetical protein
MLAGDIVVGWPKGGHGPVGSRRGAQAVNLGYWAQPADLIGSTGRCCRIHHGEAAPEVGHHKHFRDSCGVDVREFEKP